MNSHKRAHGTSVREADTVSHFRENSAGLLLTGASAFHLTPAPPCDRVTVRRRADARVDLTTGAGREASAR